VLQLATIGGAKHLGLTDRGELKAGYTADFIVLQQDPTQDLAAMNSIETVVQAGKAHQVAELRQRLPALSQTQL